MKFKLILIIVAIVGLGFFLLSIAGSLFVQELTQEVNLSKVEESVVGIGIDEKAPFWELADLAGKRIKLTDLSGEPLVLTFWTSWNQVAADQIKIFDSYLSESTEKVFKIVAINNQEDRSAVSNFMRRGDYQVVVLLDESGAIGEMYEAKILPITYFIDKNGVVRDVFVGALSQEMFLQRAEIILR